MGPGKISRQRDSVARGVGDRGFPNQFQRDISRPIGEFLIAFVIHGRACPHFGGGFLKGEFNDLGDFEFGVRWRSRVIPSLGNDLVDQCL